MIMKKSVLFILLMLPMAVSGQISDSGLSDGYVRAVETTFNSLPVKSGSRYIVSGNDTIFERTDPTGFFQELLLKAIERNTVRNVCGVSFGTPYEFVRYALERVYGQSIHITGSTILYKNVFYDGEHYDDVSFDFLQEADGSRILNQVLFIREVNSRDEAVRVKDSIMSGLASVYPSVHPLDDEQVVGGLPPALFQRLWKEEDPVTVAGMGYGFEIRIISPEAKGNPYYVRVTYGPYEKSIEPF